jgi:hypothetical protein
VALTGPAYLLFSILNADAIPMLIDKTKTFGTDDFENKFFFPVLRRNVYLRGCNKWTPQMLLRQPLSLSAAFPIDA